MYPTHWPRPHNSPFPSHLDSYTRALLVSHDRRHLFVSPFSTLISFPFLHKLQDAPSTINSHSGFPWCLAGSGSLKRSLMAAIWALRLLALRTERKWSALLSSICRISSAMNILLLIIIPSTGTYFLTIVKNETQLSKLPRNSQICIVGTLYRI